MISDFLILIILGLCLLVAVVAYALGGGIHGKDD